MAKKAILIEASNTDLRISQDGALTFNGGKELSEVLAKALHDGSGEYFNHFRGAVTVFVEEIEDDTTVLMGEEVDVELVDEVDCDECQCYDAGCEREGDCEHNGCSDCIPDADGEGAE